MNNIFAYSDYRVFLGDMYRENKERNPKFSYRYLSQKVGFRSPSFFNHILTGRTNISTAMIGRFAGFLELNRKESDYFETLVQFNQAVDHEDKKRYLEKLMTFRESKVRIMEADRYEFYEKWYHVAIREQLFFQPFNGDYDALARSLSPTIKTSEAKQAIAVLKRLKMIQKNAQGKYIRMDGLSDSTGSEAHSVAINNFHRQALLLAGEAIDRFSRELRGVSTLTFSLSHEGFIAMENELISIRSRLRKIAEADQNENAVYHLNISLFPLTKPPALLGKEADKSLSKSIGKNINKQARKREAA